MNCDCCHYKYSCFFSPEKRKYPYTDENGFVWHDPDCYTDDAGGHHDSGIGWNPHGVWCGECTRVSCKGCFNEFALPIEED